MVTIGSHCLGYSGLHGDRMILCFDHQDKPHKEVFGVLASHQHRHQNDKYSCNQEFCFLTCEAQKRLDGQMYSYRSQLVQVPALKGCQKQKHRVLKLDLVPKDTAKRPTLDSPTLVYVEK
jgi:hypothetical protein